MTIEKTWEELKNLILEKSLKLKFEETELDYKIFCIEEGVVYLTTLIKNNDNQITDFEDNYKILSNVPHNKSLFLSWSEFKIFANIQISCNQLYFKGDGINTNYYIWTILSGIFLECSISILSIEDKSDFENNYKSLCNLPIVNIPGLANFKGKRFSLKGYKQICPIGQTILDIDLPLNSLVFGGSYSILEKEDISLEDYISVCLCIKINNILYEFAYVAENIYTRFFPVYDIKRKDTGELILNSDIYLRIYYNNFSGKDLHLGFTLEVW